MKHLGLDAGDKPTRDSGARLRTMATESKNTGILKTREIKTANGVEVEAA